MTPAEAKVKFQTHTTAECNFAIRDIHATFAAQGSSIDPAYSDKLYTELDAARARLLELSKVRSRAGAVDLCHELAGQLARIERSNAILSDADRVMTVVLLSKYTTWSGR